MDQPELYDFLFINDICDEDVWRLSLYQPNNGPSAIFAPPGFVPHTSPSVTPAYTPTVWRYRRITHDSGFQYTPVRQATWERHYPIGGCISTTEYMTFEEIVASVRGVCAAQRIKNVPGEEAIRTALKDFEGEKLVESKFA